MTYRPIALVCAAALLAPACVVTSTETRSWSDGYAQGGYERHGRVDRVREVVQRQRGDPVGGAVAGAIIGGLIGGRGPAGVVGAIGGAAVGSSLSQGSAEYRWYEVTVRFDDGGWEVFTYRDYSPFRPGDLVVLGARGLDWAQAPAPSAPPPPPPPPPDGER